MKKLSFLFAVAIVLLAVSCKKDSTNTNTTPAVPPLPTTSIPAEATGGGLVSLRTFFAFDPNKFLPTPSPVPLPTIDIKLETATAVFYGASTSDLLDAGTVGVNSHNLTKASNNAYYTDGFSATSPGDVDLGFSSGSNWSVAGSSSVTAFTYNYTATFPSYGNSASLPETITKSAGLTVNVASSNADSIAVAIISGSSSSSGTVIKRVGGAATSVTFSASDLSPLTTTGSNGIAYLEVLPYRYTIQNINSKNYAFIKLAAYVKNVKIQ